MIHIVSYDFHEPSDIPENYASLIQAILSEFPDAQRLHQSVWLIHSERTAPQVRDVLSAQLPARGSLFVGPLKPQCAGSRVSKDAADWLDEHRGDY